MEENSCCFLGHRKLNETELSKTELIDIIEGLIMFKNVDTFFFGSKSQFDTMCLAIVTKLKERYSHIKRIYVRAEFPYINDDYKAYLLNFYDETYFPENLYDAGKAVYVERNYEMIDKSKYCVFYYNEACIPHKRKSGTKIALDYAVKKNKVVIKV